MYEGSRSFIGIHTCIHKWNETYCIVSYNTTELEKCAVALTLRQTPWPNLDLSSSGQCMPKTCHEIYLY